MLAFLRKHTFVAILIFGATIISFVVFMSPNGGPVGGSGGVSGGTVIGEIFGEPLTYDEYLEAYTEARLNFLMSVGEFPESYPQAAQLGWDAEQQAMNRLVSIRKQEQLGIRATDTAVVELIRNMNAFKGGTVGGTFDKALYDMFTTNTLRSRDISKQAFENFIRHQIGMSRMSALAGIAGELVTPDEVREMIREDFRQAKVQLVVFRGSNYVNDVTIDPSELEEYYTQVQSTYRLPERRTVNYVAFPHTNYVAQAELMISTNASVEAQIDANYAARGSESFLGEDGLPLSAEAAKQQLRDEATEQAKGLLAKQAAYEFANEVFAVGQTNVNAGLDVYQNEFQQAASDTGLTVATSEPFPQYQPPAALNATSEFSLEAFRLSEINPYGILLGTNAFYVAVLNEIIPSETRPLEEVRLSVESSFRNQKIRERVRAEGEAFYMTLTNGLADGRSFPEIAAEEEKEVIEPPAFSSQDSAIEGYTPVETGVSVASLVNSTFSLSPGEHTRFLPTGQNGYILHLEEFVEVPEEKINEEYAATLENLRSRRRNDIANGWFGQEIEKSQPVLYTGEEESSSTNTANNL